jgi:uncharacterized protein YuzE
MTVPFGDIQFDLVELDADADVLYLRVSGAEPVHFEESAEGHALSFDADGNVCGLTIIGLRHHADDEGNVTVTVPHRESLGVPRDLVPA